MKLVTYSIDGSDWKRIGVVIGDSVLDLKKASIDALPSNMLEFIEGGDKYLDIANKLIDSHSPGDLAPLSQIILHPPILNPPSLKDFFAFEDHAKAAAKRRGRELPEEWYKRPAYYKGNHRELYGPEDEIPWPSYSQKLDYESEIACVIGKKGRDIKEESAHEHIFGYMIFNDVSARDIQMKEMSLLMGPAKGKDFANVFGPYLVTKDEINPKTDLELTVKVNGEVWSEGHFKDQYWGFEKGIEYISQNETVYPGDILGSGTFFRGCGLDLDRWISPGDEVEIAVSKLGVLKNRYGVPS